MDWEEGANVSPEALFRSRETSYVAQQRDSNTPRVACITEHWFAVLFCFILLVFVDLTEETKLEMSVFSQPTFIFGLRTGASNNLCFLDEQTVVYPSGGGCVSHNIVQRCQRFLPGILQPQVLTRTQSQLETFCI